MSSVNQRLAEFLHWKEINQTELSRILVCKPQLVSNWLTNSENVSDRMIIKIVRAYKDVNARWLITGEGEMLAGIDVTKPEVIMCDPKAEYKSGSLLRELVEVSKECGALKEQVRCLEEELAAYREGTETVGRPPAARAG